MVSPAELASDLLQIISDDERRLELIDEYYHGYQADPYMPHNADAEYKLLARRATSNWMPLLVNTPAQAMYVDGFRPSRKTGTVDQQDSPEWKHWQFSRLDARQIAVHRAALTYGHSFTVTEKSEDGKIRTKGLSPMRTAALYEDQANDHDPYAALTITRMPKGEDGGVAVMWDSERKYSVTFTSLTDTTKMTVVNGPKHGLDECPVTRFAAVVDLEGRTIGVVEPMIDLQDRINQTMFDLLVAQTYGSFKVRWATGMAPPMTQAWFSPGGQQYDQLPHGYDPASPPAGWELRLTPAPIDHNARRFLFAPDADSKFGSLDETPLDGYIASIDMSIRHLAAISQTPPHHLLGQIANLSAEALQAAETSLSRMVESLRKAFGESWERVFRIAGSLAGDAAVASDFGGEVIWRDMEQRSMAQTADALGKLGDSLEIPKRGLWDRVPNVTQNEMDRWELLKEEQDKEAQLADALHRASNPGTTVPSQQDQVQQSTKNTVGNLQPNLT